MNSETGERLDAPAFVTEMLDLAVRRRASDIHLEPTANGYDLRLRVDGLLETVRQIDTIGGRTVVTRLMVMARLLTYRLDVPQEGRISVPVAALADKTLDLRLAIIPTTHGLRAAVRLPADLIQPHTLDKLNLPATVLAGLRRFAAADAGMFILTGPAGSGKTTTIYALLAHIVQTRPGLSVISLEDPVERHIQGVTQIEIAPFGQLGYDKALRSILRQDPQVLVLGEIRDHQTAALALQAALSGHRLISTLHAARPAGAIARLLEMGIEPYMITSAIFGIVAQRLVRRLPAKGGGRVPLAEFVEMDSALRNAVLQKADADALATIYRRQPNYVAMEQIAADMIRDGDCEAADCEGIVRA